MSAPAGTDDQVRRSAISFRQQNGANTLTAFDVHQKLTQIIPTLNTLSDQEVNRLSRLFEETYANPPPVGASRLKGGVVNDLEDILVKIGVKNNRVARMSQPYFDEDKLARLEMIARRPDRTIRTESERTEIETVLKDAKDTGLISADDHKVAMTDLRDRNTPSPPIQPQGGFKRKSQTERFSRCVKMVRKTVTPRSGSNKESAAIAICTKTILHKRGRTIKRYSKKRLVTQRRK